MKILRWLLALLFWFLLLGITRAEPIFKNIALSEVVLFNEDGDTTWDEAVQWDFWQWPDLPIYAGAFVSEDLINYDDIGAPTVGPILSYDVARQMGWNPLPGDNFSFGFNLQLSLIPVCWDFEEEEVKFGLGACILKWEW